MIPLFLVAYLIIYGNYVEYRKWFTVYCTKNEEGTKYQTPL